MRKHRIVSLIVTTLFLLVPASRAQQSESLLIGSGDLLHIVVFDSPELEQHARVTDSGEVPLLLGGNVKVGQLTPEAAAQAIEKALLDGKVLLHPKVAVTVEQYGNQNVSVVGEVRLPGAYPTVSGRTVAEVIALAGGMMPDADRTVSIERHGTKERIRYYFSNSVDTRDKDAVMVYPGDVVRVARAELVYAIGDLAKPGGFPVINNDAHLTVLQLVAMAGGFNKTASLGHIRLVRVDGDGPPKEINLPIKDMQSGKKPDMNLQANDVLYVPFSYLRNTALNATAIIAATSAAALYVAY